MSSLARGRQGRLGGSAAASPVESGGDARARRRWPAVWLSATHAPACLDHLAGFEGASARCARAPSGGAGVVLARGAGHDAAGLRQRALALRSTNSLGGAKLTDV